MVSSAGALGCPPVLTPRVSTERPGEGFMSQSGAEAPIMLPDSFSGNGILVDKDEWGKPTGKMSPTQSCVE